MSAVLLVLICYCGVGLGLFAILMIRLQVQRRAATCERSVRPVVWNMALLSVLWPLTISLRSSIFLDPSPLYLHLKPLLRMPKIDLDGWIPKNPSRCSSVITYTQGFSRFEEACGVLTFKAIDVLPVVLQLLSEHPKLRDREEGWLSDWLSMRNEHDDRAVAVPDSLGRFRYIAGDLLESGVGEVFCSMCEADIPADRLVIDQDEIGRPGWAFKYYRCPDSHPLLTVELMHTSVAR